MLWKDESSKGQELAVETGELSSSTSTRVSTLPAWVGSIWRGRLYKRIVFVGSAVLIAIGLSTLVGWAGEVDVLRSWLLQKVAMNPLTAVGFIAAGLALLGHLHASLETKSQLGSVSLITRFLAFVVFAIGALRILGLMGWDLGWDQVLFRDQLGTNRIAPNTALAFVLGGLGLLLKSQARSWAERGVDVTAALLMSLSVVSLVGYLFGTQGLYGLSTFIPMAFNTAFAFLVLALSLSCLREDAGLAGIVGARDLGGSVARRMLPVVILIPLVLGGLRTLGQNAGWYEFEFGVSLLVAFTIVALAVLTGRSALKLGRLDRALQAQSQLLTSVVDHIADGVVVVDPSGNIVLKNPMATELLDAHNEKAQWWSLDENREVSDPTAQSLERTEASDRELTFEDRHSGRVLSVIGRSLKFDGGSWGRLAVVRDITAMKVAERQLKASHSELELRIQERVGELTRARAQIEQLQKLDAIGRLAGGIAHDFNNILGAIQMCCDFITLKKSDAKVVEETAAQIRTSTSRGASLTRQLLIFSRDREVERKVLNLNTLVQEHVKMLSRLVGDQYQIELNLCREDLQIEADPSQVEQVLMNLVINARDAMPQGGRILISTLKVSHVESSSDANLVTTIGKRDVAHATLRVQDFGCGMDLATQERIFDPFFTTKPLGKGTGLGLSTVYGIVKSLEGWIRVKSEVGHGSELSVWLPLTDKAMARVEHQAPTLPLEGQASILVVEDDVHLRSLFVDALESYGYKVSMAENGRRALEKIDSGAKFDLIITDMMMPELGGAELLREVLLREPLAKVICISGYRGEEPLAEIENNPRVVFLNKPFDTATLLGRVRSLTSM
ncbi:MAG TPA: response regulator [Pseudobdellovibrionaceae bacterium]|nr:response regulator [Pseudobdellovibrionaceae bacterium]